MSPQEREGLKRIVEEAVEEKVGQVVEEKVGQVLEARIVVVVKRVLSEELPKAISNFATKEDLEELKRQMATKEDLNKMATKEDLEELKSQMATMATKEDLSKLATKEDLEELKEEVETRYNLLTAFQDALIRVYKSGTKDSDEPLIDPKYSYTGRGFNNFEKVKRTPW